METSSTSEKCKDRPPGKSTCLYISSIFLVTIAISSLSLLRLLISICHHEYTNGRTVCAPQNVVLYKLPLEIPSKTLFLRVGGLEYDASSSSSSPSPSSSSSSFSSTTDDDLSRHTEHQLGLIDRSNFSRFKDLRELSLLRCGISTINKLAFADLPRLKKLDLRFNKIVFLEEATFTALDLTLLDLSHNPIITLPSFAFSSSTLRYFFLANSSFLTSIEPLTFFHSSVQHLLIDSSRISSLDNHTLGDLAPSLETFFIINQQTPLHIQQHLFQNFSLLHSLHLSNASLLHLDFLLHTDVHELTLDHNDLNNVSHSLPRGSRVHNKTTRLSLANARLTSLPDFVVHSYSNLFHLLLPNNNFTSFDASLLSPLKHLQTLDLSGNNISALSSFNNHSLSPNLTSLSLHCNNIRTLHADALSLLSKLHHFTFQHNSLHCNCEVAWLAWFLREEGGKKVVEEWRNINCTTPWNSSLVDVPAEDLVCTPPGPLKTWHKEVSEEEGVVLSCEVASDPASNITWSNDLKQDLNASHLALFNIFKIADNFSKASNSGSNSSSSHSNVHKISLEVLVFVDDFTTRSQLFVSSPGNYTCHANNLVASRQHTFNTHLLQLKGAHFNKHNEPQEAMCSFEGALLAAILLVLLGLLVNKDSQALDHFS